MIMANINVKNFNGFRFSGMTGMGEVSKQYPQAAGTQPTE